MFLFCLFFSLFCQLKYALQKRDASVFQGQLPKTKARNIFFQYPQTTEIKFIENAGIVNLF
jgi:hypothetical protein